MEMIAAASDIAFRDNFEAGKIAPSEFGHRAHLRLAYVYLSENDVETSGKKMREALLKFLKDNEVPPGKFHETLTYSWILAIHHFMHKAAKAPSFEGFLATDNRLLDTDIMLSHYRRETLFSDKARLEFMPPDLQEIPRHIWHAGQWSGPEALHWLSKTLRVLLRAPCGP